MKTCIYKTKMLGHLFILCRQELIAARCYDVGQNSNCSGIKVWCSLRWPVYWVNTWNPWTRKYFYKNIALVADDPIPISLWSFLQVIFRIFSIRVLTELTFQNSHTFKIVTKHFQNFDNQHCNFVFCCFLPRHIA